MRIFDQRFPDKDEIGLACCGDWHLGAQTCDEAAVDDWIEKIRENKWYVILMGDLTENATLGSVGAVFEQRLSPQQQVRLVIDKLTPIKDYIIGGLGGNHGARSLKTAGLDPDEIICWELGCPYWNKSGFGRIQVGTANWKVFAHHGAGGGALLGSKLNVIAEKMTKVVPMADLYIAGHTHAEVSGSDTRPDMVLNKGKARIAKHRRHFSGTGSLLDYDDSYAEGMLLPPATKAQVVHFLGTRKHIGTGGTDGDIYEKRYRRQPEYYY